MDTDEAAAFHIQHHGAAFRHDSRHAEDGDKKRRQHLDKTCECGLNAYEDESAYCRLSLPALDV